MLPPPHRHSPLPPPTALRDPQSHSTDAPKPTPPTPPLTAPAVYVEPLPQPTCDEDVRLASAPADSVRIACIHISAWVAGHKPAWTNMQVTALYNFCHTHNVHLVAGDFNQAAYKHSDPSTPGPITNTFRHYLSPTPPNASPLEYPENALWANGAQKWSDRDCCGFLLLPPLLREGWAPSEHGAWTWRPADFHQSPTDKTSHPPQFLHLTRGDPDHPTTSSNLSQLRSARRSSTKRAERAAKQQAYHAERKAVTAARPPAWTPNTPKAAPAASARRATTPTPPKAAPRRTRPHPRGHGLGTPPAKSSHDTQSPLAPVHRPGHLSRYSGFAHPTYSRPGFPSRYSGFAHPLCGPPWYTRRYSGSARPAHRSHRQPSPSGLQHSASVPQRSQPPRLLSGPGPLPL